MGRITQVRCIIPFTQLSVHPHGYCYSCCPNWTKLGNVGRLTGTGSVMEIWNSPRMQYIRRAILNDELWKVCNFQYCPIAIKNDYVELETLKGQDDQHLNRIIERIAAGEFVLDTPPYTLEAANSGRCNLHCVMCESRDRVPKRNELLDETLYTQIIPEVLPGVSRLLLTGCGEVFANPYSLRFLQSLDSSKYPLLKIRLLTNGTLFTPELWESIRHLHYDSIYVSVDAASPEVYQKIRRNGNWDGLRQNLDFIAGLRRQKIFSFFAINFIVMKSNVHEMKDFVELGLSLGCDQIYFQKIFGFADLRENINVAQNKRAMIEAATMLNDPLFQRPEVNTALIDEYRKYSGQTANFWDRAVIKSLEWLLCFPIRVIFLTVKLLPVPLIINIHEFFWKKRIREQKHV